MSGYLKDSVVVDVQSSRAAEGKLLSGFACCTMKHPPKVVMSKEGMTFSSFLAAQLRKCC